MLNLAAPSSGDTYELHLNVKSKIGVLHKITGFLAEANIDIVSMHIQATRDGTADIVAYLEMKESEMTAEKLLETVRDLDFVQEASVVSKDRVVFEEFLFPIMVDDSVRGFLMTEGGWMSITTRLMLTYGTGGLAILHEAGVACGEEYARQLQARLGQRATSEKLLENLQVMLRAAGLGVVEVGVSAEGYSVRIKDPVVTASETKIHDHFLAGVVAGAIGGLFATTYSVEKVRFEGSELRFLLGRKQAPAVSSEPQAPKIERPR